MLVLLVAGGGRPHEAKLATEKEVQLLPASAERAFQPLAHRWGRNGRRQRGREGWVAVAAAGGGGGGPLLPPLFGKHCRLSVSLSLLRFYFYFFHQRSRAETPFSGVPFWPLSL